MGKRLTFEETVELDCKREELWPLVSDTDTINRVIGLPMVTYETTEQKTGGSIVMARTKLGLLSLHWREYPFEWVAPEKYSVRRVFQGGPFAEVNGRFRFDDAGGRTKATVVAELVTRNIIGDLMGPRIARKTVRNFVALFKRMEQNLKGQSANPLMDSSLSHVVGYTLEDRLRKMREQKVSEDIVARLRPWITNAPDHELARARPFALADAWKLSRDEVLRAFLVGTKYGLFEMQWDIICPHCRKAEDRVASISKLPKAGHCKVCNLDYSIEFDHTVEARFTVHEAVRPVVDATFCMGGPANLRHILAQALLEPGETREITPTFDTRAIRVRSPMSKAPAQFQPVAEGPSSGTIDIDAEAVRASSNQMALGRVTLKLTNRLSHPAIIVVEQTAWDSQAATGTLITAFQSFRDLFSTEVLAAGQDVAIRNIAILFTDLKGSTDLYRTAGDAHAYAVVRDHFVFMTKIISECRGTVVKTIGDAVMAAFPVTSDGVRATMRIQTEVGDWCAARKVIPPLRLKVGLHAGPAIAVSASGLLDYFGSTVNIAARLHELGMGGDVLVTDAVYRDPASRKVIDETSQKQNVEETRFRGFIESFHVRRLTGLSRQAPTAESSLWTVAQ